MKKTVYKCANEKYINTKIHPDHRNDRKNNENILQERAAKIAPGSWYINLVLVVGTYVYTMANNRNATATTTGYLKL